jgi:hypothetical protein
MSLPMPLPSDDRSARPPSPRCWLSWTGLGFDGPDAGTLADSSRQQPGTPIYTTDLTLEASRPALAAAKPEQPH